MIKIKCAGIYLITYKPTGHFYLGCSVSIFDRYSSHYTDIKMKKHSSTKFMDLFNSTKPEDWKWEIIDYISKSDFKREFGLKGKELDNQFRKHLLKREKYQMGLYSINLSLNKNNKNFT
jgi:predicted GIY-YIG superfamily endonuclease